MIIKKLKLVPELKNLYQLLKNLDRKVVIIFLSVAVLQTVSWYYTSRQFFKSFIFHQFQSNPNVYLLEYLYWFIGDFLSYFILPFLIIKILLKERVKSYGLTIGDFSAGLKISFLFLTIMIPLVWIASSFPEFNKTYPHLASARDSWITFFIFETGLLIYMFSWEFVWRGFMLFGLEEKFGYYTVLIQMIPFLILHDGKPAAEAFGAIVAGIALGILALRTRSILYCVIVHMGVMFSIDLISTLRYRAGDYGIGLDSFLNIIYELL